MFLAARYAFILLVDDCHHTPVFLDNFPMVLFRSVIK